MFFSCLHTSAFAGAGRPQGGARRSARPALLDGLAPQMMQELMKDPAAMKQLQEAFANVLKDPKQREAFEEQQRQMASALEKLSLDPALKQFFQDIQKDGLGAMKKYENDGGLLKKLTAAMGGAARHAGPARGARGRSGDEVVIDGLSQAPELNGRRATVVSRVAGDEVGADGAARVVVQPLEAREPQARRPGGGGPDAGAGGRRGRGRPGRAGRGAQAGALPEARGPPARPRAEARVRGHQAERHGGGGEVLGGQGAHGENPEGHGLPEMSASAGEAAEQGLVIEATRTDSLYTGMPQQEVLSDGAMRRSFSWHPAVWPTHGGVFSESCGGNAG
eukprot:CAMPEP_0179375180 /NCGR_PEP_ID=MMETSP0797-20121207/87675_1 /TAXON_ID=47934 /ORGANISM="Dinophysis acuminata, Strain DAEP01" /LENGTH=334 /DNA_ID=CAMNT_0021091189 /DNA_START=8 /DNA_END=1007 /DNA_ORIENTATION=-